MAVVAGDSLICKICGKEFSRKVFNPPYEDICSFECFDENFWLEWIYEYMQEPDLHAIIKGNAYSIGKENVSLYAKGCDGRKFKIKKNDGSIIVTTNLRFNGEIPDKYRDKLADDADFVWRE